MPANVELSQYGPNVCRQASLIPETVSTFPLKHTTPANATIIGDSHKKEVSQDLFLLNVNANDMGTSNRKEIS
jgi:hypothetical protein